MSATANDTLSNCAHCGKGGEGSLKAHCQCKTVKYCNVKCKTKHWAKHKKKCNRIVAELYNQRFKEPPPNWELMDPIGCEKIDSAPPSGGVPFGELKGSIGNWDQFSANEKKFNVKVSFDENLYTTKLDFKNIDYERRLEAERVAMEIEGMRCTKCAAKR